MNTQWRKPVTKFGGTVSALLAPNIFLAVPQYFNFWGHLIHIYSYIDESGTDFKVQTPVPVKQPTGEKTKRGRS